MSLWDDDDEKTYAPITPGHYTAVLDESKLDASSTPNVVTTVWKIVNNAEFANRKLWIRLTFADSAKKFVKWQTGVLGIASELKECASWEMSANKCHDYLYEKMGTLKVEVDVTHREYNGKTYENAILLQDLGTYTPSDVHAGVENSAPTFDDKEELPF